MTLCDLFLFMADLSTTTGIALRRNKGLTAKERRAVESLLTASNDLMEAAAQMPYWLSTYEFSPADQVALFTFPDSLCDSFGDTVAGIRPQRKKGAGRKRK
jgi:hypothetical protein